MDRSSPEFRAIEAGLGMVEQTVERYYSSNSNGSTTDRLS